MITTAQLQALSRPKLARVFAALGQDLTIARTTAGDAGPPPDVDAGGAAAPAPAQPSSGLDTGVRGLAYQLSAADKAKLGAQLAVPLWNVILPWDAPVDVPGFEVVLASGQRLLPISDAENIGEQLIAWQVVCRVPSALTDAPAP